MLRGSRILRVDGALVTDGQGWRVRGHGGRPDRVRAGRGGGTSGVATSRYFEMLSRWKPRAKLNPRQTQEQRRQVLADALHRIARLTAITGPDRGSQDETEFGVLSRCAR